MSKIKEITNLILSITLLIAVLMGIFILVTFTIEDYKASEYRRNLVDIELKQLESELREHNLKK